MITRTINGMKKLWQGEQPLGRAFWVYFVMGWIGFVLLSIIPGLAFLVVGIRPLMVVVTAFSMLVYPVFAAIGVWRSANTYRSDGAFPTVAPALAKLVVLVALVPMGWNFLNGGLENLILNFMG